MPPTIVYIHGVGPKEPATDLKKDWDEALFGRDMQLQSRMAYWADLRTPTGSISPFARMNTMATNGETSPEDFIDGVMKKLPGDSADPKLRPLRDLLRTMTYNAEALVRVGTSTATPAHMAPANLIPGSLPPPVSVAIFREFLEIFVRDAYTYFYTPTGREIRQRLVDQLAGVAEADRPVVVVGHSLGSVIAYDVLHNQPQPPVAWFVTAGSPLGVDDIKELVAQPLKVPDIVASWLNVAAHFDPVALDPDIADDYPPQDKCTDRRIWNLPDPHDAVGYLRSSVIQSVVLPLFA